MRPLVIGLLVASLSLACAKDASEEVTLAPACNAERPPFEARFTRLRGNAWWVETDVEANAPVVTVLARVVDGAWRPLAKTEWGSYATSLHAPKGALVELRALSACGDEVRDGRFRWPEGERVPTKDALEAQFVLLRGNPYWLEVDVLATAPLLRVDALLPDGERPLSRTAWGSWALSSFLPPGTPVVLRARAKSGEEVLSDEHLWPPDSEPLPPPEEPGGGDEERDDPDGDAPGDDDAEGDDEGSDDGSDDDPALEAVFSGIRGNRFWVEVDVGAGEKLRSVHARVGDGAFVPLERRAWGSFAAALRVPIGAEVVFLATGESGARALSRPVLWPPG